jgi:hypothetical protein
MALGPSSFANAQIPRISLKNVWKIKTCMHPIICLHQKFCAKLVIGIVPDSATQEYVLNRKGSPSYVWVKAHPTEIN